MGLFDKIDRMRVVIGAVWQTHMGVNFRSAN